MEAARSMILSNLLKPTKVKPKAGSKVATILNFANNEVITNFLGHNRDQTIVDVHSLSRFENFVDILVINPKNVLGTFFHESIIRSDFNGCR